MSWQSGEAHLVLLSEVCKEEEVGRLGTFELSRISGTLLSPGGFWMILLILCHDHTVIRLQEHLPSPEPLASLCHIYIYIYESCKHEPKQAYCGVCHCCCQNAFFQRSLWFDTDTAQLTTMYTLTLAFSEDSSYPRFSSSDNDLHFSPAALATSATFLLSGLSIYVQGKQSQKTRDILLKPVLPGMSLIMTLYCSLNSPRKNI